MVIIRVIRHT